MPTSYFSGRLVSHAPIKGQVTYTPTEGGNASVNDLQVTVNGTPFEFDADLSTLLESSGLWSSDTPNEAVFRVSKANYNSTIVEVMEIAISGFFGVTIGNIDDAPVFPGGILDGSFSYSRRVDDGNGSILFSLADQEYGRIETDGRYYNCTKDQIQTSMSAANAGTLPLEYFSRSLDSNEFQTKVGFDYNDGCYDDISLTPVPEISPYPESILSDGWRARDATSGSFKLKGIETAMRINALKVVTGFPGDSSYNPYVEITIDGETVELNAAAEAPASGKVGTWTLPAVVDGEIDINWVPTFPGNSQFCFLAIDLDYTLIGPYLVSANDSLPIGNGSTGVQLQGRKLDLMTTAYIDGVPQTLSDVGSWKVNFDLNRSVLNYGPHTMVVSNGSTGSSSEAILGPQDGWLHTDIGASLYVDDTVRVSATPELEEDDQVAYSTEDEALLIYPDGSIVYYGAMPADVPAEVWSGGDWTDGEILLGAGSGNEDL